MNETIELQLTLLEAEAGEVINQFKQLDRKYEILMSVPGISHLTAGMLLAVLPEIGELSRQSIASAAGLVPSRGGGDAGSGQRPSRGNRPQARTALYIATLAAVRCDPTINAAYRRFTEAGKAPKVALAACMRKLLVIANALVRQDRLWSDKGASSEADEH